MNFLRIYLSLLMLVLALEMNAERTDSFAITQTVLKLKIRNIASKYIVGEASHKLKLKVKTSELNFDIKKLNIDSVKIDNVFNGFNRNGDRLTVYSSKVLDVGDTCEVIIYYQGTPAADPGGWGGFYFTGDYAYNLGVGFSVNPHSFGRAWFPCVDEFKMKSAYEFYIETDSAYTAACNGLLIGKQLKGDARIWHYKESFPMSAYLASVSVSKFAILSSEYNGIERKFPIQIFCKPSDTTNVKSSFARLPLAIQTFEEAFGAQMFAKVGYNLVPFNAGAMEHAGNITFPAAFANGSRTYEETMVHELSHHWWGDNATCNTEADMWLNEGWASYCAFLFTDKADGKKAYKSSIIENHLQVLRFAHINDANIFSLINIPKEYTYGNHVYKKGADVIHSLRAILGDSVFFVAAKKYQEAFRAGNASTDDMKSIFTQNGGGIIASSFFDHWVKEKGFPHVIIDKQTHTGSGPFHLKIHTIQKPRFTNLLYTNMPLEVFFFRDRNYYEKRTVIINALTDSFEFNFSFKPVFVCTDFDEKLSDAITENVWHSNQIGSYDLPESLSRLVVNKNVDSSLLRIEHHWVGPEKYRVKSPYMSDYRYYSVDGIWNDSFAFDLELSYDGRQGGPNSNTGYLDHTLIFKTEDSLTVLYRGFPGDYWRVWPNLQFAAGSKNDKQGKILIKNARKGDYVLAMYDNDLGIKQNSNTSNTGVIWNVLPNPAMDRVVIQLESSRPKIGEEFISIINMNGSEVLKIKIESEAGLLEVETGELSSGLYYVCYQNAELTQYKKLIISK